MKNIINIMTLVVFLLTNMTVAVADGLLQVKETEALLRLSKNVAEVQIFDQIALTTVIHEFINTVDADSVDVTYMFPLPESASVTGISTWRDSAFVEFELAVADTGGGNQTFPGGDVNRALRDYLLPNPFIVPMTLTTDTFRVQLSYAELLPFDFGAIRYVFPLNSQTFSVGNLDAFAFLVTLSTQRTIKDIQTPNYAAGIDQTGPFSAIVGFDAANFVPSDDFIIDYQLSQEEVGLFTLTYFDPADTTESAGFFVSLLEPGEVQPGEVLNKHFTFVLDRSGSMSGGKIVQAKAAARFSIEHLNSNDFFNIVDFSSSVAQFRNEAVLATEANVSSGVAYIESINAGGGTNINEALLRALLQTIANEVNQVIFLTDGQATSGVTNTDDILGNVLEANQNDASIFVFGVGNGVEKNLLQALADQNHGVATFIPENESIDDVIVNFFARISNPVLVDVSLDFGTIDVFDVFPVDLPDMFAGFQQVITGRYASFGSADITLNGSVANADTAIVYPNIPFPDSSSDNIFIPKIWAKKKIEHLFARWLTEGEPDSLKQEIIAISLKYGVLSPFTRFDEPVDDGGLTAIDGVQLAALQSSVAFDQNLPRIRLTWQMRGDLSEIASIEVFRKGERESKYRKLATLTPEARSYFDLAADPSASYTFRIELILVDGTREAQEIAYQPQLASVFAVAPNYPNPFNPSTQIIFFLGRSSPVEVTVFNITGERVKILLNKPLPLGRHEVAWDGKDSRGRQVSSGVYFYQVRAEGFSATRRMVLAK